MDAGTSEPDAGTPSDAGTLTVNGTVEDETGIPLANVTVLLPGSPPVRTNASGAFQFHGVTPPYELIITDDTRRGAIVHRGITRLDPILTMSTWHVEPAFSALLDGTLHGAGNSSERDVPSIHFVSSGWPDDSVSTHSGPYDFESAHHATRVWWDGPDTVTGTLYAYQRPYDASAPSLFGQRDHVQLRQGDSLLHQDVTLHPVENGALTGSVTLPPGFQRLRDVVSLELTPSVLLPLFDKDVSKPVSAHFSHPVPLLPQATFALRARAYEPDTLAMSIGVRRGLRAGAPDTHIVLQEPVTLLLPQDSATGVGPGTEFTWTAASEAVYVLLLEWSDDEGRPFFLSVFTNEPHDTLPDLSGLGLVFPRDTSIHWRVRTCSPFSSVDDLLRGMATDGQPRGMSTLDFAVTASREFLRFPPPRARP
ncbi:carboxypeptidase-like regulatory domain-containing protein [Melittangium boletus]|uniref:carboxypeptidase-like regulatory domain-containing protein n=1 Tax=Melittangium boletus TaxID=83453 RepID=UPI003DA2734E